MPRSPREIGAYGNKRGKEAQARRRRLRENDPRYQRSMKEVRAHQERIDKLAARSTSAPGTQSKLTYTLIEERKRLLEMVKPVLQPKPAKRAASIVTPIRPVLPEVEWYGDGKDNWSLQDAAEMLAQGYTLRKVVATTGYGAAYFVDLIDYLDDDPEAQALLAKIRIKLEA